VNLKLLSTSKFLLRPMKSLELSMKLSVNMKGNIGMDRPEEEVKAPKLEMLPLWMIPDGLPAGWEVKDRQENWFVLEHSNPHIQITVYRTEPYGYMKDYPDRLFRPAYICTNHNVFSDTDSLQKHIEFLEQAHTLAMGLDKLFEGYERQYK